MDFLFGFFLPLSVELGILAGLAVAISGYLKEYSKKDSEGNREKFSIDKFITTVFLGAIVGGILSFIGSLDTALTLFLVNAGVVAIVGSLVKAIIRIE